MVVFLVCECICSTTEYAFQVYDKSEQPIRDIVITLYFPESEGDCKQLKFTMDLLDSYSDVSQMLEVAMDILEDSLGADVEEPIDDIEVILLPSNPSILLVPSSDYNRKPCIEQHMETRSGNAPLKTILFLDAY